MNKIDFDLYLLYGFQSQIQSQIDLAQKDTIRVQGLLGYLFSGKQHPNLQVLRNLKPKTGQPNLGYLFALAGSKIFFNTMGTISSSHIHFHTELIWLIKVNFQ